MTLANDEHLFIILPNEQKIVFICLRTVKNVHQCFKYAWERFLEY